MTLLDEILPLEYLAPKDLHIRRLQEQRERDIERRNEENVLRWHIEVFGEEVGGVLGRRI